MELNFGTIELRKKINLGSARMGIKKIYPALEDIEINPTTEEQTFLPKTYGFKKVFVKKVEGQELTITPGVEEQVNEGLFEKVTVSGDSNLISENIKAGTSIFGIEGTAQIVGEETEELIASYMSCIDNSRGANITKLPSGITAIGDYGFYERSNLAISEFPETVEYIGNNACSGCTNLALTKFPEGLKTIGSSALQSCPKITISEMPVGISNLPTSCLRYCTGITKLICKSQKISIVTRALSDCSNLKIFAMPNIVEIPTLNNSNAFANTPIAHGTGYIYVPDEFVEQMKVATNWSIYADQILPKSEMPAE